MPQTINGAPNYLEPSRATAAQPSTNSYGLMPAPVQVDTYADRLMDDLFEDVEDLLSGSVPPPEPIRVKPQPSIDLPLQTAAPLVFKPVAQPQLPQWSSPAPEAAIASKRVKSKSYAFQKFLAIVFGLSALSAASVWLIQRGTMQRFFALAAKEPTVIATAPKVAPVDTTPQFAQYMKRSLENIDRRANNPKATTVALNRNLPSIPIAGNSRSTNPSDRTPVVINVPSVSTPNPVVTAVSKNPQELNQVLTRLSSVLERLSINPTSRSQPVSAPIAIQPAQATSSEPQRTLRGIAIATDPTQSAILFEMNGVTQRYYIGESIGSSGWSVVDISNNYVSIRRNGEVRTISIGQKL
ncbi:hypothetical protein LEP3755_53010 [Leptolyngbya sp. NIES-3755]|nr:hypothetical protein LEP3755_53010 [Leptolyngbya sp. NIES-3755]